MIWRRDEPNEERQPERPLPSEFETRRESRGDRMAEQGTEVTIIGQGARLEGTIVSAGSLRIDGQVKGEINADGDVILSPQSQVEADIKAENVTVAGRFKGNVMVKNTAELARGGRVEGNVTSKTLIVQEGAVFSGQSVMEGAPKAEAAAAPSRPEAAVAGETRPAPTPAAAGQERAKIP